MQPSNYFWRSKVHPSHPFTNHPCTLLHLISLTPPKPQLLRPYLSPSLLPPLLSHLSLWYLTRLTSSAPLSILCSACLSLTPWSPATFPPFLSAYLSPHSLRFAPLLITVPVGSLWTPPSLSLSTFWHSLCVAGELPSVFHLPLSHLSHSLPADPPTQRVLTIHAGGHTHSPELSTVFGRFVLCCSSTAGGVSVGWERSSPSISDLGEGRWRTKST